MENITKFWFLKDFDLFEKMGKKNLMAMVDYFEMINFKKGQVISLSRANKKVVYFLKKGTIKIVNNENEHTRFIVKKGNVFGELALYEDSESNEDEEVAIVLEDALVCLIEAEQMKEMLEEYSSLKNQLLKLHGLKIRKLQSNLEDLLYKNSKTRIKEYVLNYICQFGKDEEGVMTAKNLLSHQDIAHLTNTSRQTVSNVMSNLRKDGIIDYNSKEIVILQS